MLVALNCQHVSVTVMFFSISQRTKQINDWVPIYKRLNLDNFCRRYNSYLPTSKLTRVHVLKLSILSCKKRQQLSVLLIGLFIFFAMFYLGFK